MTARGRRGLSSRSQQPAHLHGAGGATVCAACGLWLGQGSAAQPLARETLRRRHQHPTPPRRRHEMGIGRNAKFLHSGRRSRPVSPARVLCRRWPQGRADAHHDAPVVATGGMRVVVGAAAACSCEPELVCVDVPAAMTAAVLPVAVVVLARLTTMAAAPRAVAAPAPRVMADTQASPLLRASCRAEPEVDELIMVPRSGMGGSGVLRCSWSMPPGSSSRLCDLLALPLNRL